MGTNVLLAFPRSPAIVALEAGNLQELTGDRFVLGLGSQVRRIIEDHFSSAFDHPARRMAEYIRAVRTVWSMQAGRDVTFDGEFYRITRPGSAGSGSEPDRVDPPILVAAIGPLMTRVAVTQGDGVLGHPFTSDRYVMNELLPRIEQAATAEGVATEDPRIYQGLIVSVSNDRDAAIRDAKRQIGFYGTTPNYRAVFDSYGDGHLTGTLRDVWKRTRGDARALEESVPNDRVLRYAIAGTPDEVRDQVADFEGLVDQVIASGPWYGVGQSAQRDNIEAIIDTLGTST